MSIGSLLKGAERCEDRSADPDAELALSGGHG